MAYAPIAKLDNFTGKENNAQSLVNKPQDFNAFKVEFLRYFSNNNSINCLVNIFTTMKQGETEAVTTYLECFHQNLHQIQAIDTNYFTVLQILNQFIHVATGNAYLPLLCSLQQSSGLRQWNLGAGQLQNLNFQNYLSLLVTPEDASTNNLAFVQNQPLTSNISPATITEDKSLASIFSFKFEETTTTPLFSEVTLEAKPITVMYTDAKVEGQSIKLILNSSSADSIITRQLMDQLGHRVNQTASTRIITADGATKTPIGKINDFPFEVNGIVTPIKVLVIEVTQYQALVGRTIELEVERRKGKEKEKENTQANNTYIPYTYGQQQSLTYRQPKLICVDCSKKLLSMGACCGNNEEYQMTTKFYCHACHIEHFGKPKQMGK
ncbi:hypothetical protein G9A89_018533 [Geosiphon pyriformis]|nr:hypothetical protein G9A89_018533 [Geosiphon pyriformis]